MPPLNHSRLLDEETRSLLGRSANHGAWRTISRELCVHSPLVRSALVKGGAGLFQQERRGSSKVAGS